MLYRRLHGCLFGLRFLEVNNGPCEVTIVRTRDIEMSILANTRGEQ